MNTTVNEVVKYDTVSIAKRYFGNRANGKLVDCKQREYDNLWEMLQKLPDPTLEPHVLADMKARSIPHPYKWIVVDVVEPFVIEGITKSLKRVEQGEKKNAE